jgi:hypothetical protein
MHIIIKKIIKQKQKALHVSLFSSVTRAKHSCKVVTNSLILSWSFRVLYVHIREKKFFFVLFYIFQRTEVTHKSTPYVKKIRKNRSCGGKKRSKIKVVAHETLKKLNRSTEREKM